MRRPHVLALTVAASLLFVGCSDDPDNEANPDTRTGTAEDTDGPEPTDDAAADDDLQVSEVATGLVTPWGLAPLEDGGLLIGSRDDAEISLLPAGGGEPTVVGSVDGVRAEGESGLLGLALTEDESTLYAYRTGDSENGVVKMSWDGETLGAPEEVVSGIPGGASFHQGGGLVIGPDDLLYLGTGDNGNPPDAQDADSLSGKVLRFTLDGEPAPDNPSGSAVLSLGHRNVEGLVFDDDGRLWESEFGQDRFDELNLVEAGSNYGWPEVEGTGGGDEYVDPAAVWSTDDASPSGIAWWDGSLWLAGLQGERLWEVEPEGADVTTVAEPVAHLTGRFGRVRNAVSTADGSTLWVVTSNTDGRGDPDDGDDRLLSITR
ncbi:sorbosone dehydrogenase family protein [Nocardioides sp.]|uniref:PQQ-dependent sugar dehydrogenase n=1 Tax=Nocardioides sp. TaxID=35761 RepID=UPI00271DD701|nr:PQQ-dependent sugar dehydrogenase [Nocardioides sp.]MDO9455419.1 PQQ-dependent sugar dehydrogenase [Nocardioides sp.]